MASNLLIVLLLCAVVGCNVQEPLLDLSSPRLHPHRSQPSSCPNPPKLSCQLSDDVTDTCCLNYPGGQFALTQFWNSDASKGPPGYLGPNNSWTLHGLWPDHCDGSYDSSCDPKRNGDCSGKKHCNHAYRSIHRILNHFGRSDLLDYMTLYWKGIKSDEHIWQHEWSKHGTCVSTLEPRCYVDYAETEEVVDYFAKAVELFQGLPTFNWLEEAGIVPSHEKKYDLEEITAALYLPRGVIPVVACQGHELREVWYFFNVRGSVQLGQFVPSEPELPPQSLKSCPKQGIRYLPKGE